MKRILLSKVFVFLIISLFVASYFPQVEVTTNALPPDNNRVAQPMYLAQLANSFGASGYSPSQIRNAYDLPASGGEGDTIAIIDAFDTPNITGDLTAFSNTYGLPAPTSSNFQIAKMTQNMDTNDNWTIETSLDVEWAHAIAPDAKILLVEAISDQESNLLSAVDYARNQPDVVAVSMSWGVSEYHGEVNGDSTFTSNHGVAFFASSGDNGTGVIWPACSTNVVSVGGTTLNLNSDGTVISETAWSKSGGGVSAYEPKPAYQISYGTPYSRRAVPDVSYNGNPATGVSVFCNSQWYIVGGTSAGAPQWAAIYALGLSATNANLYSKAKLAYSSYFRDIVTGSNGNPAGLGYDLVTGLGSPITCNFGTSLTISPFSGPAGGTITLNGGGFTSNSSVNISWLNPLSSTWISMANNVTTDYTGNFTYIFKAPDLLQNNIAGDNQPSSNDIIFCAQDSSNGKFYNSTIPYSEWRRGLVQIGNLSATGLYGNNTDLTTTIIVQNNQSITVTGNWFNPNAIGNASLFWDGAISLGTTAIDATGQFIATVQVPTTSAGPHMLTITDGSANFCVNITRLPTVTENYTVGWHTTDTTINLSPDLNVIETFYRINNGPILNVTADGQPIVTTEGSNNSLEYWSVWNIDANITNELPHVTIIGIQLQKTPPQGSIQINNGATSTSEAAVTLTVTANDLLSGVSQIRFSNDGLWDQVPWGPYNSTANWQLTSGDGVKTVYYQIIDNAGLIANFSASIVLSTPQPIQTASPIATSNPSPTPSNSPGATITPNLIKNSPATETPSPEPSKTPAAPELNIQIIVILLALSTGSLALTFKRKNKSFQ